VLADGPPGLRRGADPVRDSASRSLEPSPRSIPEGIRIFDRSTALDQALP